jgi:hypothetical protein
MDSDLILGFYVIVVLCLIVTALSLYKIAHSNDSYFANKASLPLLSERSDFVGSGSMESPVFWNMGSVQETNAALQSAVVGSYVPPAASTAVAADPSAGTSSFNGAAIKNMKDFASLEHFAGAGL